MPHESQSNATRNDCDLPAVWVVPTALRQLVECGDGEWVEELIVEFQTDTASRLDLLSQAVANADYGAVRRIAHSIKGSAAQIGANRMADVCRQMELESAKVQPVDVAGLFRTLIQGFEQVRGAIASRDSDGNGAIRGE
jgi:HPt (histidine-containing phosphotransfer) domain-containing protein